MIIWAVLSKEMRISKFADFVSVPVLLKTSKRAEEASFAGGNKISANFIPTTRLV